jgi:hypothetical protein
VKLVDLNKDSILLQTLFENFSKANLGKMDVFGPVKESRADEIIKEAKNMLEEMGGVPKGQASFMAVMIFHTYEEYRKVGFSKGQTSLIARDKVQEIIKKIHPKYNSQYSLEPGTITFEDRTIYNACQKMLEQIYDENIKVDPNSGRMMRKAFFEEKSDTTKER